jgi:hypothetical protein
MRTLPVILISEPHPQLPEMTVFCAVLTLNAIIKRRIPVVRSYYSLRTLRPLCANTFQHSERIKLLLMTALGMGVVFIIIVAWLMSSVQNLPAAHVIAKPPSERMLTENGGG